MLSTTREVTQIKRYTGTHGETHLLVYMMTFFYSLSTPAWEMVPPTVGWALPHPLPNQDSLPQAYLIFN